MTEPACTHDFQVDLDEDSKPIVGPCYLCQKEPDADQVREVLIANGLMKVAP